MNEDAQRVWAEFKDFTPPNLSNAARHAMVDAHLRRELAADPAATVVIIGAGFDTRAFRLKGGRWMRKKFFERYSRPVHEKILGMGATVTDMVDEPERLFLAAGYTMVELASIPMSAAARKSIGIPSFVVRWFLRTLRNG